MINTDQILHGKVILVYLINPPEDFAGGIAIRDPEIKEFCGRDFLSGVVPSSMYDWSSGQRIGVAFDQIASFLEFKDDEEFFEKTSLSNRIGRFKSSCESPQRIRHSCFD